jgi:hypothetical protein
LTEEEGAKEEERGECSKGPDQEQVMGRRTMLLLKRYLKHGGPCIPEIADVGFEGDGEEGGESNVCGGLVGGMVGLGEGDELVKAETLEKIVNGIVVIALAYTCCSTLGGGIVDYERGD